MGFTVRQLLTQRIYSFITYYMCINDDHINVQFDQAIQAGLDAPHLGVGITAGEPAAYESFKDIMDVVIEGWHGYKPTDSHKYCFYS